MRSFSTLILTSVMASLNLGVFKVDNSAKTLRDIADRILEVLNVRSRLKVVRSPTSFLIAVTRRW
jgi:hypothetical protein